MATRLERFLSHGSISNIDPGKVTGTLWFINSDQPVLLELEGNPHRDIAGAVLAFEQTGGQPTLGKGTMPEIAPMQRGIAGDITASKKVMRQEGSLDSHDSETPGLSNALCIEWYDEAGERFVIESTTCQLHAGEPEWQMDVSLESEQLDANTLRFHDYIDRIANRISDDEGDEDPEDDESPLDEFEWEERLKESDRITQAYMEALDKYQNLPDQERLVAAAMGWSTTSDPGSEVGWSPLDDADSDEEDERYISLDEFEAEMSTDGEGRGDENHPLYERAHDLSVRLHRDAQDLGILESEDEPPAEVLTPAQILVFATMELSTKLAGALNGISAKSDPEPGLVVAWLKRGLPIVDRALGAVESAIAQDKVPRDWIESARQEVFELRDSILDLIQEFRSQLP